jgi:RNA polymerase sigma factor (sigma-70 family)
MSTNPQQHYIQGLISGDSSVLNLIYQNFEPRIIEYIKRKGGRSEDAQDIFQEALIIILQKAKDVGFELRSSFYSFLFGICRNLWLQKIIPETAKKAKIPAQDTEVTINYIENEMKSKRYNLYQKCLQKLSDNNRLILELAMQNFSNKEIAEKMGIESYGYIRIKKMRAKKELMTLIQQNSIFSELCRFD